MFSWFKGIFRADSAVEHIAAGVDKAIYTKEEKADAFQRMLELYEPFKVAQRVLAFGMFGILAFSLLLSASVYLGSLFWADNYITTPNNEVIINTRYKDFSLWLIKESFATFGEPFLYAVIFYYGGGSAEGLATRIMDRRKRMREAKPLSN
ncbi:hypothetical protein [Vibrio phage YC]|uniref:Uncharacterized protein n=1 Tax=Vibrio phage YC TaxID=2267403 RepID=A0A384ZSC2_9CAUD|nr:hypothetical protein HWB64_gp171 [Vibrio phage YC]AXC34540.1 hypothetical protein [Vibrio phage YC]